MAKAGGRSIADMGRKTVKDEFGPTGLVWMVETSNPRGRRVKERDSK